MSAASGAASGNALTPKTITEPERLRREIEEVARTGVAFDDGEFDPEVRCVAVPVRDFTGQVAGAIGISRSVWRLSLQVPQTKTEVVREAARRFSAELGYRAAGGTAGGTAGSPPSAAPAGGLIFGGAVHRRGTAVRYLRCCTAQNESLLTVSLLI